MSTSWGLCKDCKWWQIEPKAPIKNSTMGLCIDDKTAKIQAAGFRQQRMQSLHGGQARAREGIERPAADGEADAVIDAAEPHPFPRGRGTIAEKEQSRGSRRFCR